MSQWELKGVGDSGLVNGYFIFIECYISQIRSLRYSGNECEKMWSRDLGSLLLASNGDSGILHNC